MPGTRKGSEAGQRTRQRPDTLELGVLSADIRQQQQQREQERELEQEQEQQEPDIEHWSAAAAQPTAATTRRSRWFNFASKSRRRRLLRCEEEQMQLAVEPEHEHDLEQQQVRLAQPEITNIGNSTLTIASPAATHIKPAVPSSATASSHLADSFYSLANADAGDEPKAAIDVEQQYKEQPPFKPRLSVLQRFASWRRSAPDSLPSRRHSRLQSGDLGSQPQLSASASARNLRRLSQMRRRRSSYYFSGKWERGCS